jgi:hypothetical protein
MPIIITSGSVRRKSAVSAALPAKRHGLARASNRANIPPYLTARVMPMAGRGKTATA